MNDLTPEQISSLGSQALLITLLITTILGAIMQKTSFCTLGAVSDGILMEDWSRMRQWCLAIGIAILGVALMSHLGWIDVSKSFYTGNRVLYLSTVIGSTLFGIGMVLASGCGSKTLVRIGGGNLKSIVVFIVLGLVAYMTMRGFLGMMKANTIDKVSLSLSTNQDLPSILSASFGIAKENLRSILALIIGGVFIGFALSGRYAHLTEDPNTLQEAFLVTNSGRMESLSFVAPYAFALDWMMFTSDKSKILTIGIVAVIGMILGSAISSILSKNFRWESFRGVEDTANHLVGAALMGFGGVTAVGCTIGQGLSGLSTLALNSFIAFPGFILGAYIGLQYLQWRLSPKPC